MRGRRGQRPGLAAGLAAGRALRWPRAPRRSRASGAPSRPSRRQRPGPGGSAFRGLQTRRESVFRGRERAERDGRTMGGTAAGGPTRGGDRTARSAASPHTGWLKEEFTPWVSAQRPLQRDRWSAERWYQGNKQSDYSYVGKTCHFTEVTGRASTRLF